MQLQHLPSELVVRLHFDLVVDSHSDLVICWNWCFVAMEILEFSFLEALVRDFPNLFQHFAVGQVLCPVCCVFAQLWLDQLHFLGLLFHCVLCRLLPHDC